MSINIIPRLNAKYFHFASTKSAKSLLAKLKISWINWKTHQFKNDVDKRQNIAGSCGKFAIWCQKIIKIQ